MGVVVRARFRNCIADKAQSTGKAYSASEILDLMYRATPVTYFISAIISTGIAGAELIYAANELVTFDPSSNQSCGVYLEDYLSYAGGRLLNPSATKQCQFCPVATTDDILATLGIFYDDRWRNFVVSLAYSVFNVGAALGFYWLFRMPKGLSRRRLGCA